MTGEELTQFLLKKAEILVCEHCNQEYGNIPDIEGEIIPKTVILRRNGARFFYYRDRIHCILCGLCAKPTQKESQHHLLGDALICGDCYKSFASSCYTFEVDMDG